jgi:hypothetical protein
MYKVGLTGGVNCKLIITKKNWVFSHKYWCNKPDFQGEKNRKSYVCVVVFYHLSASEIWHYKRVDLWWEELYKRDTTVINILKIMENTLVFENYAWSYDFLFFSPWKSRQCISIKLTLCYNTYDWYIYDHLILESFKCIL